MDSSLEECNARKIDMIKISFINFVHLSNDELKMVYEWRNLDYIRNNMTNSSCFSFKEHLEFCKSLKHRNDKLYFLVKYDEIPCGVYDLIDIDYSNCTAECGYYIIKEYNSYAFIISKIANVISEKLGKLELRVKVKKNNIKALLYNLLKLKAVYEREDDEYFYLRYPFLKNYYKEDLFFKKYSCDLIL